MATQTISQTWGRGSETITSAVTVTDSGGVDLDLDVPAASTNLNAVVAFTTARLKLLVLVASVAMTVKTNSSTVPGDTYTLAAGVPLVWFTGCGLTNPVTVAVTGLYVTSTLAGTLKLRVVEDATP